MNTAVNINPTGGGGSGSKVAHIFREHGLKFSRKRVTTNDEDNLRAIVLRRFVLELEKNKLPIPRELSQKLSVYKKRALVATDPKTKERNQAKVLEIENKIAEFGGRKRKGREASLIEASWSITMFPPELALKYDQNIHIRLQKIVEEIHKKYFPTIAIEDVGIAAHVDQATIHLHTCFNVPHGTTYTAMLNSVKADMIEKEEFKEGESLYSKLQQDFNNAVRIEFPDLKIDKISGIKKDYLELKDYKKVPQVVEVEVIKEVEKIVEKEVIKEVEVEKVVEVVDNTKILELEAKNLELELSNLKLQTAEPKIVEVEKIVIKEVEVEVIKEVEVEKIVEVEVIKEVEVEKVVHVQDNTRIEELQEALESTKSLLADTQTALGAETQKTGKYKQNNEALLQSLANSGYEKPTGESFWQFLTRVFIQLFTKIGDLTKENAQLKKQLATQKPSLDTNVSSIPPEKSSDFFLSETVAQPLPEPQEQNQEVVEKEEMQELSLADFLAEHKNDPTPKL